MNLPDADALTLAVLGDALPAASFGTQIPHNLLGRLPFNVVRRFGGAAVDPRFLDRATISVDSWAGTRKGAFDEAAAIRTALRDGVNNATPEGHIVAFREVSAPAELRTADQADNVWRFTAIYSLFLRPATV